MEVRWKDSYSGLYGMKTGLGLGFGLGETMDRATANGDSDVGRSFIIQHTEIRLGVSFPLLGHSFH